MNGCYVTTSIPYVNAAPHLGHALEFVQADVLARHKRLRRQPVRFLTGTDDNALKNVTAARAAGVDVATFVNRNADRFAALRAPLSLSYDDVIRTSTDPRHAPGVAALWRRCAAAGDFYRHRYEGLYCAGCERFVDSRCPEHPAPPERVAEQNWFFRLSRYAGVVEEAITSGRVRIEPATRRNEVLAFVRSGLCDISVSRPAERAGGWGIPVPDDPGQVVYVWWDALANYVTALGYGQDGDGAFARWWAGSAERVHVIGKGIVRFHAVHWLALLSSAGLPLPTAVFVHPYLTVDGAKISKSAGNGVDPAGLVNRLGVDALRWWLVREVGRGSDTDFTQARLVDRANRELAGGLGNLVNRTVALVHRHRGGRLSVTGIPDATLARAAADLPSRIDAALQAFDLRAATDAIWSLVELGNRYVEQRRPWELARDRGDAAHLDAVLAALVGGCRVVATECGPFLPDGAARLRAQLGAGAEVGSPGAAFPRLATTVA